MAEWKYSNNPKTNARMTLANEMPVNLKDGSDRRAMENGMQYSQIISDIIPRRQEDHPANSQKYKQIHEEE